MTARGLPAGFDPAATEGLGLSIVRTVVKRTWEGRSPSTGDRGGARHPCAAGGDGDST